ncbi:probable histone-arginine methyltransferase CARM1 isoform X1 [Physcomitrium patens]|uniref:type I protein arginine methyltransferase n=1 Tax=Physcomitrium patens TaxID=3218 RepID=A0A7I4AC44_PHYPA
MEASSGSETDGDFNGMSIFPLIETVVDGGSEVLPAFGRPISVSAVFKSDRQGRFVEFFRIYRPTDKNEKLEPFKRCYLHLSQVVKIGPKLQMWVVEDSDANEGPSQSMSFGLQCCLQRASNAFYSAIQEFKNNGTKLETVASTDANTLAKNKFEEKIDPSSAKMYFHYYGQLLHQQNMLQDYVRTGTYYAAVIENHADFHGKVVVDVGAGSGILSLFAAQASAKHVYAIEASAMADNARLLIAGSPSLSQRITVIHGKVEEVELPEKADILISDPMGTLLVNERMLESYIIARDRFLVPNGKMFPSRGRLHMAPFRDELLYGEIANKALFWQQKNYYGVDLTALRDKAFQGYFSQPVVDAFDPRLLIAQPVIHDIDFVTAKEEDFFEIDVPLQFKSSVSAGVHGLACWFDVLFDGSAVPRWLTTSPGSPTTHWYQIRCLISQPLCVLAGQPVTGRLHMIAHSSQSYTVHLTLSASSMTPDLNGVGGTQTSTVELDLKEPYYRMTQFPAYAWFQQEQTQQPVSSSLLLRYDSV